MKINPVLPMAFVGFACLGGCSRPYTGQVVQNTPAAIVVQDSIGNAIRELGGMHGSLTESRGRWEFEGDTLPVNRVLSYGEGAIAPLASCLSSHKATQVVANGKKLSEGMVCYWLLRRLIYFEPDLERPWQWPGFITPGADSLQQERAADAWGKVVRDKSYGVL